MSRERTVVGIDVGTTKVCTLIAEVSRSGNVNVVGVGVSPSRGMRKGIIVDIGAAVESIGQSVEKAQRVSGFNVVSCFAGIAGNHITSFNSRGFVAVSQADKTICEEDVARAIEASQVINIPSNREIIHTIPRHFIVDGQDGIRNPVGMLGYRLDVETHMVTGAATAIQNLRKCFLQLGIEVEEVVLEPLASSESILTEEEREMGVALVDIGGGTTDLAIFADGSAWHTGVIPVGGRNITYDIASRLRTPMHEAEELKIQYGRATSAGIPADEVIDIATFGGNQSQSVSRVQICEVIQDRLVELFQLIDDEIKRSGYHGLLPAGIVLTGGTADTEGIVELASDLLQVPVRVGLPTRVHGLVDVVGGPAYATSVGLLLWGARQESRLPEVRVRQPTVRVRGESGFNVAGRVVNWLRTFLP